MRNSLFEVVVVAAMEVVVGEVAVTGELGLTVMELSKVAAAVVGTSHATVAAKRATSSPTVRSGPRSAVSVGRWGTLFLCAR